MAGRGPTALLVHGYPFDASMWLDQLGALSGLRRLVAPDLRGFGASEPVTDRVLSMERHADDLAALIAETDELDGRADVVAMSMGGYAALALWERHPGVVRSLALLNTRSEADDEAGRDRRDRAIASVVEDGRGPLASGMLDSLLAGQADATVRARVRTMIEGTRVETIVAALRGMRDRPDRTDVLATIDVPTLTVTGDQDRITGPEVMGPLTDRIAGARLEVVAGAGHVTPVEQPDAVSQHLAGFWSDTG